MAAPESFARVAEIIIARKKENLDVVVVVSAMGNTTDELIALAKKVHPNPPKREFDMLVSAGERISIALLAMALELKGVSATSFTGSQSGIITSPVHTDACIIDVRPFRLIPFLERGDIVIVAGFQGVSREGQITTLGRSGSDTTAVALGVSLHAERVEFYKDVPGVFSSDPKCDPAATHYREMSFAMARKAAESGVKFVLHPRCLALAEKNHLPLFVRSFQSHNRTEEGTWIGERRGEGTYCPQYEVDESNHPGAVAKHAIV